MTNKEAIIAALQIAGYSDNAIQKALIDAAIDGTGTYVLANAKTIDLIAIEVLQGMLSVSGISEGGYSITYSIEGVKLRLNYLLNKYGMVEVSAPKIRNKSYLW